MDVNGNPPVCIGECSHRWCVIAREDAARKVLSIEEAVEIIAHCDLHTDEQRAALARIRRYVEDTRYAAEEDDVWE